MEWREIAGNWVLIPSQPEAIIHFLGGAFVATAPQLTYRTLLEFLAEQGYVVIATPFVNTLDHGAIALDTLRSFRRALDYVQTRLVSRPYLPIYGLGHSLGCKLHLLIGSQYQQERAGNIFMAFNNYSARRAVPFAEQVYQFSSQFSEFTSQLLQLYPNAPNLDVEFTPSPDETFAMIGDRYPIPRNLLLKFTKDDIDQTRPLHDVLLPRFPDMTTVKILKGNHLTPLGQDVKWQAGSTFTPFDAIGQFVRQEVTRDLNQLKKAILMWLNPLALL
ncbi:MAG: DUF1350 family protein [Kaiparowitsia implicata GSE-PSE-MK54-09C]|jgi:hypothetical protein|nr:DUF1350 family protein [Kaiparowitsia implicata GSE-PSE-MK54-09C]